MSGVYGDFLDAFPELHQPLALYTDIKGEARHISCLIWDEAGSGIIRNAPVIRKGRDTVGDISAKYSLYIDSSYRNKVNVGDYFYHPKDGYLCRIVKDSGYDYAAGYFIYFAERVMGSGPDKDEQLIVKGPRVD